MRNQNGFDKVVLVSLLVTQNMFKIEQASSFNDNDQINAAGKEIRKLYINIYNIKQDMYLYTIKLNLQLICIAL